MFEHNTCGRIGSEGGSGGRMRLRCRLLANKRSRVDVANSPTGPIIYLSSATHPATLKAQPPPFCLSVFDLPFRFRMDGNVTEPKEETQKEWNQKKTQVFIDQHRREKLDFRYTELKGKSTNLHIKVFLQVSGSTTAHVRQ